MKTEIVTGLILLGAVAGCLTDSHGSDKLYQIRIGNRSNMELRSIVIDPDGLRGDFGFFGKGDPLKEATAGFCQVRFDEGFAIEWNEAGTIKKQVVDLARYKGKKREIKSFGFFYLGDDKWAVVARSGTRKDSPIVQP